MADTDLSIGTSRGTLGRQERGKETRRNLIRTAARLWGERDFDSVTVEEICSEAGVGRTTFYLHFESKERLLASFAGATSAGVAADLDEARAATTLDEQLDVMIRGIVRRMQAVPKSLAQLVIRSQLTGLMKASAEEFASSTRFADLFRMVLADARRRGELVAEADPAELGEILGAVTMGAIDYWAAGRTRRSLGGMLQSRFALVIDHFRVSS